MTKTQKNWLVLTGILGAGLVAYVVLRKYNSARATGTSPIMPGTGSSYIPSSSTGGGTSQSTGYPIKMGSSGPLVMTLQTALVQQGAKLPKYGIDGKFGSETQAALRSLYKMDSVPDEKTLSYIRGGGVSLAI